jgi:hypothetical protein
MIGPCRNPYFFNLILIGYIEWNDSSICVPRKCVSESALITADIVEIGTAREIKDLAEKLADIIVDWNLNKIYNNTGGDKRVEGNCQVSKPIIINIS